MSKFSEKFMGAMKFIFGFVFIGLANAGAAFIFLKSDFPIPLFLNIVLLVLGFIVWGSLYYKGFNKLAKESTANQTTEITSEKPSLNFFQKSWNFFIKLLSILNPVIVNSVGMAVAAALLAKALGLSVAFQIVFLFCGFMSGAIAANYFTKVAMRTQLCFNGKQTKKNREKKTSGVGIYFVMSSLTIIAAGTIFVYLNPEYTTAMIISAILVNIGLFIIYTIVTKNPDKTLLECIDTSLKNSSSYLAILTSIAIAFFNFFAGFHVLSIICDLFGINFSCIALNWILASIGALVTFPAAYSFYMNFNKNTINDDVKKNLTPDIKHPFRFSIGIIISLLLATTLTAQIYGSINNTLEKIIGHNIANLFITCIISFLSFYLCFRTFMIGSQLFYPKEKHKKLETTSDYKNTFTPKLAY